MTHKPHTNVYGWERIAKVEGEIIRDMSGDPVSEIVWITTTRGDVFACDLRKGETLSIQEAYYKRRGWTDERCDLFRANGEG